MRKQGVGTWSSRSSCARAAWELRLHCMNCNLSLTATTQQHQIAPGTTSRIQPHEPRKTSESRHRNVVNNWVCVGTAAATCWSPQHRSRRCAALPSAFRGYPDCLPCQLIPRAKCYISQGFRYRQSAEHDHQNQEARCQETCD